MGIGTERTIPKSSSHLLRHCYCFVNEDWQHLPRDSSTDQGFESSFREGCVQKLGGWVVSQHREMNLGMGLITASGILHEIDVVTQLEPTIGILELKNRATFIPDKNDVIVFFAKLLDYICHTPSLLRAHLVPIFLSSYGFQQSGLAACLGLGIHPIAPQLRPPLMLLENADRMSHEVASGLSLLPPDDLAFDDFCVRLRHVVGMLWGASVNERFDQFNDLTIAVRALGDIDVNDLAIELKMLNAECSRLIQVFKALKKHVQ